MGYERACRTGHTQRAHPAVALRGCTPRFSAACASSHALSPNSRASWTSASSWCQACARAAKSWRSATAAPRAAAPESTCGRNSGGGGATRCRTRSHCRAPRDAPGALAPGGLAPDFFVRLHAAPRARARACAPSAHAANRRSPQGRHRQDAWATAHMATAGPPRVGLDPRRVEVVGGGGIKFFFANFHKFSE